MFKKSWLWFVVGILLLLSLPGVLDRWDAEIKNQTYEIAVPLEGVIERTEDGRISVENAISELQKAGLTSVSIEPLSLLDMEERGIITTYSTKALTDILQLTGDSSTKLDNGFYFSIPENEQYQQLIEERIEPEIIQLESLLLYFVSDEHDLDFAEEIGYDVRMIEHLKEENINIILRMENSTERINQHLVQSAMQLEGLSNSILFYSDEVVGFPESDKIHKWAKKLHQAGFTFYLIEFTNQQGFPVLAKATDYNIARLHSINLDEKTVGDSVDQAVRAVKERNIQAIYFHMQEDDWATSLENAKTFIKNIHQKMPPHFQHDRPHATEGVSIPIWQHGLLVISGMMFTYLMLRELSFRWISIIGSLFMALVAALYFLMDEILFLQVFALMIAVITPIYATVSASKVSTGHFFRQITLRYVQALGITFLGILLIVGLLNGNAFMSGVEIFRGVKLVYVLPILFTGVLLFKDEILAFAKSEGLKFLHKEIKYWHVLVILFIGIIGLIYITRTGNSGFASEIELALRNLLEDIFYVRPRTKEFLIGFPFFILGLYLLNNKTKLGKVCLTIGVIGFLSVVNTFTHFHIPLYVSVLRTVYSVVLGYGIGLLLIWFYRKGTAFIQRRLT